ncbi:MAG: redox-regulated ATPase YchF [Desulfobacterota bacterium]|nr:redox-regulated ATPase YchF [Thermodesulfobacteriota bacterium]MDW8002126.1 redox-regulated ATPase YchF [Deltaproteobacteria bacterium]
MGVTCGIIGLPNSGKTTIFNAITGLSAPNEPYPFCTIEPNVGIVSVPDERLDKLASILKPERVTATTMEFFDVAGLIKDAHKGEGLGNKFLSHIRSVDALAHVVRCFHRKDVTHMYGSVDPIRDIEIVETELVISDLEVIEDRIRKLERISKISGEKQKKEMTLLLRVKSLLERNTFIDMSNFDEEELSILKPLNLLSSKPFFYVANIDEDSLNFTPFDELEAYAKKRGTTVVYICGRLEEELASLPKDEKKVYMEMYGLKEVGALKIIRTAYSVLGLITFYTIVGKEVRAWAVRQGTRCSEAARKIHSDMERGFIKAEVLSYEDFLKTGSEKEAKEKGYVHIEGRDYVVKDGDILHIKFHA